MNAESFAEDIVDWIQVRANLKGMFEADLGYIEKGTRERMLKTAQVYLNKVDQDLREAYSILSNKESFRKAVQKCLTNIDQPYGPQPYSFSGLKKIVTEPPFIQTKEILEVLQTYKAVVWQNDPFELEANFNEGIQKYRAQNPGKALNMFEPAKPAQQSQSPEIEERAPAPLPEYQERNWKIPVAIGGAATALLIWHFRHAILYNFMGMYKPLPQDPKIYKHLVNEIRAIKKNSRSEDEFNSLLFKALRPFSPEDREVIKEDAFGGF